MVITNQSYVVLFSSIAFFLFASIVIFSTKFLSLSTKFKIFTLYTIITTISTFIFVYSVNCMVVGECNVWSWIVAIIVVLNFIFLIIVYILISISINKAENALVGLANATTTTTTDDTDKVAQK